MPFPPFTLEESAVIERFVELVLNREQQVAKTTGISGSFAKALHDVMRDVRAQASRARHKDASEGQAPT